MYEINMLMNIMVRIRVSGELGSILLYIAIIGIIGGLFTAVITFIQDKVVKSVSIKKY